MNTNYTNYVCLVYSDGDYYRSYATSAYGIRPALVLPGNALFDETTKLLKGVK